MNNVLKYKNYIAKIEYDYEEKILFGKIEGITDLITFESTDSQKIEEEFHNAVDDYLAYCATVGKNPNKSFKGSFNVRIAPELHRLAVMQAIKTNRTLNEYVEDAIKAYTMGETPAVVINNYEVVNNFNNQVADYMKSQEQSFETMRIRGLNCAKLN